MSDPKALVDLVVGDRFWLAYAQDAVRSAVGAPEQRAAQLRTAIGWFWTVYSAAGILALAFGDQQPPGPLGLAIALPSLLLMIAYWQAGEVSTPRFIDFDPRVPDEIAQAHALAAQHKRKKLRNAEAWTAFAALAVGVSLAAGALVRSAAGASVDAHLDARDPARLLVTAEAPPRIPVLVSVSVATGSYESGPAIASALVRADAAGAVSAVLTVPKAEAYRISAVWRDAKTAKWHTVSTELKRL